MPDLEFHVEGAEPVPYAAAPLLAFKLRITQPVDGGRTPLEIHSVALRCQVRIEPGKRRYSSDEQKKLIELFGEPHRCAQTLHSMLWVNAAMTVPAFAGETRADLLVPCTFDFNVAQTKYFHALDDGQVPLSLLFSGTVFYAGDEGALQVEQISWEKEAGFRMDVSVWKKMMEMYYPNSAWLCLRRDVFDKLHRFKTGRGAATWEQALEVLLASSDVEAVGQVRP